MEKILLHRSCMKKNGNDCRLFIGWIQHFMRKERKNHSITFKKLNMLNYNPTRDKKKKQ